MHVQASSAVLARYYRAQQYEQAIIAGSMNCMIMYLPLEYFSDTKIPQFHNTTPRKKDVLKHVRKAV